jgi:anti-anti-sigma factor
MKIHEQQQGAVLVLKPEGPLSGPHVDQFKNRLFQVQAESLGRFVLDASAIPLLDSEALETLVEVNEEMAQSGRTLKLCAVSETVRQILELTGLAPLFEHFEDANSAVRSFL